jgi:hypothetical protein
MASTGILDRKQRMSMSSGEDQNISAIVYTPLKAKTTVEIVIK